MSRTGRACRYLWSLSAALALASPAVLAESPAAELEEGIAAFNRSDPVAAMAAFRRAAQSGSAEASVWLGWILDQAEENEEAARRYREAAERGNPAGMARLAELYAKGEGVAQDHTAAIRLLREAADAGYGKAMTVLAAAYRHGELGLTADARQADEWTRRAAEADPGIAGRVP